MATLGSVRSICRSSAASVSSTFRSWGACSWASSSACFSTPTSPSTESTDAETEGIDAGPPRVVVFGGNGYVGTHICQAALNMGFAVSSIARSGRPSYDLGHWGDQVEWLTGDALQPETYESSLEGATGVICCIGAFGTNEQMLKANGETNVTVLQAAAAAKVPRAVFVSAHQYNLPDFVLKGYVQGKKNAEETMTTLFPDTGVILRPGFVYGTRMVGSTALPLGLVGKPMETVLKLLPTQALAPLPVVGVPFVPPVSVEVLSKVAALAVSDSSFPAGVVDPWKLQTYA